MWVFIYKFDSNSYLIKYKARLVARSDLYNTDYKTYVASLTSSSFRAIIAITVAFDLDIKQFNAINAFVNATLTIPIACHYP